MPSHDLDWVISRSPKTDLLGIRNKRFGRLANLIQLIKELESKDLPLTVGLFGNWGCGKTTFLAYLAQDLQDSGYTIIYFNAWKYAGFMEIVPALIYQILETLPIQSASTKEKIAQIMFFLGNKYGSQLGEWASKFIGVNPSDILKDIFELGKKLDDPRSIRQETLKQYYTQVDKAQDLLQELLISQDKPFIVLIDELDRCDPGEAFDVIKQLRIFFSMPEIKIIFILSANPEPIGLAIRHQYGLGNITDYEAKRILEKFVDKYVDMSDELPLGAYVKNIWQQYLPDLTEISYIHYLDTNFDKQSYHEDTVKNCDVYCAITTNNRLYSNLRVLEKSLHYVLKYPKTPILSWSAWHLEILKQVHSDLAKEVSMLADEISWITANAHVRLVKDLLNYGQLDDKGNLTGSKLNFTSEKGNTAFSVYRSWFWEASKGRVEKLKQDSSTEGIERLKTLRKWLGDHNLMTFIACMAMQPILDCPEFIRRCTHMPAEEWIDEWRQFDLSHFSWLLANYYQ